MARFGSGADLARELGITRQAISQAEKSGRITRAGNGKFDLDSATIQFRLHTDPDQQRRAMGQNRRDAGQPAAGERHGELVPMDDYSSIRRRRELQELRLVEMDVQEREGALVNREVELTGARRLASAVVQQLQAIPDRAAAECGIDDSHRRKLRRFLRDEIDRIRAEFARAGLMAIQ